MAKKNMQWKIESPRSRRALGRMLAALAIVALTLAVPYVSADKDQKKNKKEKAEAAKALKGLPITELSSDEAILHAMNRLGFGPRPGDLDRVRQMGLEKWIEQQLKPESLNDSAVNARLERFSTLTMSTAKLYQEFPQPQVAARQAGMTPEEYRKMQQERQQARIQQSPPTTTANGGDMQQSQMEMDANGKPAKPGNLKNGDPLGGADPNNPPAARLMDARSPQRLIAELSMAKVTRAIYSERQLEEQMVDFWFNHFNVFAGKGQDRWMLTSYERDVIRPHVMGKFKDLLEATAKSPAMLFYLDNWMSADPDSFARMQNQRMQRQQRGMGRNNPLGLPGQRNGRLGQQRPPQNPNRMPNANGQPGAAGQQIPLQRRERGLNENYARELMELHTLGVDGGYTQQDVIEVAKCFTGWTMRNPRQSPDFTFEDRIHDKSTKTVLGHKIHAGGMRDGEEVLNLLAHHPATARFISTKIARHFVADNPPAALVDRMAKTFQETDGDIRAVLHTMIYSREFWSKQSYRAKIKTPFELVASAARALGTDVDVALPLVAWTNRIGEPLYLCQPPTGYKDTAETWVNTGALLNRLNFALALASNRMRGARTDVTALLGQDSLSDPKLALGRAIEVLLANQVSPQTRATLEKQLSDPQVLQATLDDPVKRIDAGTVAGLVLGAPEFQRR
jgi:uncharacterized protein (DUF1800 family)